MGSKQNPRAVELLCTHYELDNAKTLIAIERLKNKESVLYAFCGKMASGKDTIAILVEDLIREQYPDVSYISFSWAIRQEIDAIIKAIKTDKIPEVGALTNAPTKKLEELVLILQADDRFDEEDYSAFVSSNYMARALSYWGNDVRRAADPNYWAKKSIKTVVETIASGKSVFITDARFVNEIQALISLGAFVVLLEAPEEVRVKRIVARDGIQPSMSIINHPGELSLDKMPLDNYSLVISTDRYNSSMAARIVVSSSLKEE